MSNLLPFLKILKYSKLSTSSSSTYSKTPSKLLCYLKKMIRDFFIAFITILRSFIHIF